jgi:hypothetical protein
MWGGRYDEHPCWLRVVEEEEVPQDEPIRKI